MTGDDVKSKVLRKLTLPSDETDLDDDILDLINESFGIMATEAIFLLADQSLNFVAGDKSKDLAAGTVRVREAYISGEPQGLRRANDAEIYRYGSLNTTGKPRLYWEANEKLFVFPTPDAAYTIKAVCEGGVTAIDALGDTIPVAPAYAQCVHWYVTWQIASPKTDLAALAAECKDNWSALLTKAWNLDKSRFARKFGGRIPSRPYGRGGPRIITNTVLDDL